MGEPVIRDFIGSGVSLGADDPAVADYIERLYAAFPPTTEVDHEYTIAAGTGGRFAFRANDQVVTENDAAESLIPNLVQHLNRMVAGDCPHVLIHGGCVERDGVAVILPAYMEHGKTTLTTGLVRAGFRYLTDEAAAVRRDTHTIVPYPKPMSIDPGSWFLFPELEPNEPFATNGYKTSQWQVPPAAIRPDALGIESRARFVVFPAYDADATTELIPLSRAEALIELSKNTFRFDREGRPTLDVLGAIIRESEVYRLPNSSLDGAVRCVSALFD